MARNKQLSCGLPRAACCPPGRPVGERPLLSFVEAVKVMALFKVLANDTRIRLLHHLVRSGEACVSDLARTPAMRPQAVSNQLQRLADTHIPAWRREANNVYDRVVDRCVPVLLDRALCVLEDGRPASVGG